MARVMFRGRDKVRTKLSDRDVVSCSTKHVDPGTHAHAHVHSSKLPHSLGKLKDIKWIKCI